MLFDWFTIAAQIVNFLILVLLLKHFLYGPIIRVMDAREARIAGNLAEAEAAAESARRREAAVQEEQQRIVAERAALMAETRKEVEAWRERALEESRLEVERLRKAWLEHVDREREAFLERLKSRVAEQVIGVGEKVLRDLAHASMQQEMVRVFVERLERENERLPFEDAGKRVIVRCGLPLPEASKEMLRGKTAEWFPGGVEWRWETDRAMGIGIEMVSGDRKIRWTLESYLEGLERNILGELPRVRT